MNGAIRLLASVVGILFLPGPAYSAVYDAVADFNATGIQSSGATWTYGTEASNGGPLTLMPRFGMVICGSTSTLPSDCQPDGAHILSYFDSSIESSNGSTLLYNQSGTTTYTKGASGVDNNVVFPTDVLGMSPGNERQVIRWTAPIVGIFNVNGFYQDLQRASGELCIQVDGVIDFSSSFSGATTLQGQIPFSLNDLSLVAGDTIDFVVFSLGNSDDNIAGLSVRVVSAVPEPNTLAAVSAALVGIAWRRRRRVIRGATVGLSPR